MLNDRDLIIQFLKHRSEHTLGILVRMHERSVFNLVHKVLKNRELAEEVSQDAFIKSFKDLKKLDDPSKYKSWLLTIAYRKAIDKVRLKKPDITDIEGPDALHQASTNDDPLTHLQSAELKVLVEKFLNLLNELDRAIITLYYLEDMKISDVANATRLSENNVKIRLMRSRRFLKEKIETKVLPEDLY